MSQGAISFQVELKNAGFGTVSLSDVTVRYWFTADGNALSGLVFACDYASNANMTMQAITGSVNAAFAAAPPANTTPTSDSYMELSFASSAGNLPFGGSPATVQVRVHGGPSSQPYMDMFNEANDYSFDPNKTMMLQLTQTITAYVKGQLVWGCEP